MYIKQDDLRGPEIIALLQVHLDEAYKSSPPDSVYALDLKALQAPDITFWSAWEGGRLLGCGALKHLTSQHGEIKSMHTAAAARGRGVGRAMLRRIIRHAKAQGLTRLSLETGSNTAYAPARALYTKFEFTACSPFSDYKAGTFSAFMTLRL